MNKMHVDPKNIFCIASKNRIENIGGVEHKIYTYNSLPKIPQIKLYFNYGFLTREKEKKIGTSEYVCTNKKIIADSEIFIQNYRPDYVFLASSGAVYDIIDNLNPQSLYGLLKLEQESRIKKVVQNINSHVSICRIFNISGEFITKPQVLALNDFITSAIFDKKIEITSPSLVVRRYCYLGELIRLIVVMADVGFSCDFDSGGYEIELRKLAQLIADTAGASVTIIDKFLDRSLKPNIYYSKSKVYEELLMRFIGIKPLEIEKQIKLTYDSIIAK